MMVREESVTGNMRPSGSVLSRTPRASNQATVSVGENRWSGEMSARSPRGKMLAQRPRIEAGMGDVAATAPGNSHLAQKFRAAFENRNFIFRLARAQQIARRIPPRHRR